MKTLTLSDIRALKPCYDPVRYLPEAWSGTILDVLNCTACPEKDRIWVAVRLLPREQVVAFAGDCASAAREHADKVKAEEAARAATRATRAATRATRAATRATRAAADWATAAAYWVAAEEAEQAAAYWAAAAAEQAAATRATRAAEQAAAYWAAEQAAERARQIEVLKQLAQEVV